jgi:hypothetical protein
MVEHGLLDHLVRPQQQRLRDCEPEGSGGFQVNDERKLIGLFHGKIAGLGALEDLIDVNRRVSEHV